MLPAVKGFTVGAGSVGIRGGAARGCLRLSGAESTRNHHNHHQPTSRGDAAARVVHHTAARLREGNDTVPENDVDVIALTSRQAEKPSSRIYALMALIAGELITCWIPARGAYARLEVPGRSASRGQTASERPQGDNTTRSGSRVARVRRPVHCDDVPVASDVGCS